MDGAVSSGTCRIFNIKTNRMKKILIALSLMITVAAESQLTVELGATKTDLKDNAIRLGITYLRSLDSIFGNQEHFLPGKKSFFLITPELDIQTGTEDAFSSINLKATGLLNFFKTTTVAGLLTPDYNKTFHTFPISLGVETNNQFNNTNGILEVGWIPYYQSYGRTSPTWIKKTNFGIFLQGGYKFDKDTAGLIGGEVDESLEREKRGIFRVKGSFGVNTDRLVKVAGFDMGIVATADGWGDIVNSEFYHKLEGRIRIFLGANQYLDAVFSSGSGAPLFNEAEQFGVGLTMRF